MKMKKKTQQQKQLREIIEKKTETEKIYENTREVFFILSLEESGYEFCLSFGWKKKLFLIFTVSVLVSQCRTLCV